MGVARVILLRLISVIAVAASGCAHSVADNTSGGSMAASAGSGNVSLEQLARLAEVKAEQIPSAQHERLLQLVRQQRCPCPAQTISLAECANSESACLRTRYAVRTLILGVTRGESDGDLAARYLERFGPREPEQIHVKGAPCRGSARAQVQLIIFSDFQCPFCSMARQLTEDIEKATGDQLQVCFKHFPLTSIHPYALPAARAAAAAQLQGKFWEMHDQLFAHQNQLEPDDLLAHAEAIGLDMTRFAQDLTGEAAQTRVRQDQAEAMRLQIRGTPTFFINGREMTDPKTIPDFLEWIAEAEALAKTKQEKKIER